VLYLEKKQDIST